MAKRKTKKSSTSESLEDIAELAGKLNVPDDALDGDLRDACDDDADMAYQEIKESVWLDKLNFLYLHGFSISRLREIVVELGSNEEEPRP